MVQIGHITLARSFNGTGEHFVSLVEGLASQGVEQHVVASNNALLQRVAVCDGVTVSPATGSMLLAFCLLPKVDVAHIHDAENAEAGLLLALTRAIPYVLTHRAETAADSGALRESAYRRSAGLICGDRQAASHATKMVPLANVHVISDISRSACRRDANHWRRSSARHLKVYRRACNAISVPALLQ